MAALLDDEAAVTAYLGEMRARVQQRLDRLAAGFAAMRADGYPVEAIAPQGAIYLSVRIAIPGQTNEATRQLLLTRAGLAVVPFQAFGLREDSGWFRISVGAVSLAEIDAALPAPAGRAAAPLMCRATPPLAIGAGDRAAAGAVRVRREQARRRADARADRGADGARARERRGPAHLLSVRPAAHDADAAVHRAGSAGAAVVALSVAAGRDRGPVSVPGVRAAAGAASRPPSWRPSRWRCRRCTSRRRRPPPARRCTCCCGCARSSGCWPRSAASGAAADVRARRAARVARGRHALRRLAGAADRRARGVDLRASGIADRRCAGLAVFSLCAASLPVAWLAWGARAGGDPLFFAHYIMTDHAGLAADVAGRSGRCSGARASSGSGRWRSSRR